MESCFTSEYVILSTGDKSGKTEDIMMTTNTVALLAPVPLEHLESGEIVCHEHEKVAYGSNAWEVFAKLDELRNCLKVHTFIYASGTDSPIGLKASWQAVYIGYLDCKKVTAAYEAQYRPPTTRQYLEDNRFGWTLFWELESLKRLDDLISIHHFRGLDMKLPFNLDFIPEGPILIEYP